MYLIVTNDKRIPKELQNFDKEVWTKAEFIEKAAKSEDGLSIADDDTLCLNIDVLDEGLYNALRVYEGSNVHLEYYKFEDQTLDLSYMKSEIKVYKVDKPKPEPIPEPIKPPTPPTPEPVVEQPKVEELPKVEEKPVVVDTQKEVQLNKKNQTLFSGLENLIQDIDDTSASHEHSKDTKIIAFISAKGGSSKSTTALMTLYHYAKTHPTERIACLDLDLHDPQISIVLNMRHRSITKHYKDFVAGDTSFDSLKRCAATHPQFASNIDFYLPPSLEIEEISNNADFWKNVLKLLSENYDFVIIDTMPNFFKSDAAKMALNIADKAIIPSNTSVNSVKSVFRQLQIFNGDAKIANFKPDKDLLKKCFVSVAKMNPKSKDVNNMVRSMFNKYVPICAEFGIIEDEIEQLHWYQNWNIIFERPEILKQLENIEDFSFLKKYN